MYESEKRIRWKLKNLGSNRNRHMYFEGLWNVLITHKRSTEKNTTTIKDIGVTNSISEQQFLYFQKAYVFAVDYPVDGCSHHCHCCINC